eukprot:533097-Rhodomonas_salina.1
MCIRDRYRTGTLRKKVGESMAKSSPFPAHSAMESWRVRGDPPSFLRAGTVNWGGRGGGGGGGGEGGREGGR